MKPIAIFRHSPEVGPGYFCSFLEKHRIPWQLFCIDANDALPANPYLFSGLCFLGGRMSVNDPLPWIPHALTLIQKAIAHDIPVIGHCLGGQLMAKALGGRINLNSVREIGWHSIQLIDHHLAYEWLGKNKEITVFQWHEDTFSIPAEATRIAGNQYCQNQMFVLGKHIGMQCHIEMTRPLVESWCTTDVEEIEKYRGPAAQNTIKILNDLDTRVQTLNRLASHVYQCWIKGL